MTGCFFGAAVHETAALFFDIFDASGPAMKRTAPPLAL